MTLEFLGIELKFWIFYFGLIGMIFIIWFNLWKNKKLKEMKK